MDRVEPAGAGFVAYGRCVLDKNTECKVRYLWRIDAVSTAAPDENDGDSGTQLDTASSEGAGSPAAAAYDFVVYSKGEHPAAEAETSHAVSRKKNARVAATRLPVAGLSALIDDGVEPFLCHAVYILLFVSQYSAHVCLYLFCMPLFALALPLLAFSFCLHFVAPSGAQRP